MTQADSIKLNSSVSLTPVEYKRSIIYGIRDSFHPREVLLKFRVLIGRGKDRKESVNLLTEDHRTRMPSDRRHTSCQSATDRPTTDESHFFFVDDVNRYMDHEVSQENSDGVIWRLTEHLRLLGGDSRVRT